MQPKFKEQEKRNRRRECLDLAIKSNTTSPSHPSIPSELLQLTEDIYKYLYGNDEDLELKAGADETATKA